MFLHPISAQLKQSEVDEPKNQTSEKSATIQRDQENQVDSDEILIPRLHGLAIATNPQESLRLRDEKNTGIHCSGFTTTQEKRLQKVLAPWMGKPVSLNSLNRIARQCERAISSEADSLLTATFPPQEITAGAIGIVITTPKLEKIVFSGQPEFGGDFLSRAVLSKSDGTATAESVRKDLEFLNRNPFRKARALWTPAGGDEPAANLIIQLKENRPWNFFTGVDNYASDALGDERLYVGGKWGNVFGLDHRLSWLFLSAADGNSLYAGNVNYEIPLKDHTLLHFGTSFSASETRSPTTLIDNNGEFFSFRGNIEQPLPDWHGLRHRWQSGFSFRENEYRQGLTERDITIFQIENQWLGEYHDRYGFTEFSAGLNWNPGSGYLSSDDATYRALGASDSNSWVTTIFAKRNIDFSRFGKWEIKCEGQWTNERLIPSNQFAGGGVQRIRGYDEGSVFFDRAMLFSTEWEFPKITLPGSTTLRPHLFYDQAWLADQGGSDERLGSIGTGVKWSGFSHYSSSLELALPMNKLNNEPRNAVVYFSFNTVW